MNALRVLSTLAITASIVDLLHYRIVQNLQVFVPTDFIWMAIKYGSVGILLPHVPIHFSLMPWQLNIALARVHSGIMRMWTSPILLSADLGKSALAHTMYLAKYTSILRLNCSCCSIVNSWGRCVPVWLFLFIVDLYSYWYYLAYDEGLHYRVRATLDCPYQPLVAV